MLRAIPTAPKNLHQPSPKNNQGRESTETPGVPCAGSTLAGTLSQHRTHGWARAGSWHHSRYHPPRSHHSEHTWHRWTSLLGSERTHTHSRVLSELDIQTLCYCCFFCFSCVSQNFLPLQSSKLKFLSRGMGAARREGHCGHPTKLSSVVEFGQLRAGHGHPSQGLPPKPIYD